MTRKLEGLTVVGLIGDYAPGNEHRIRREALRTFVNVQERAKAVPGAIL